MDKALKTASYLSWTSLIEGHGDVNIDWQHWKANIMKTDPKYGPGLSESLIDFRPEIIVPGGPRLRLDQSTKKSDPSQLQCLYGDEDFCERSLRDAKLHLLLALVRGLQQAPKQYLAYARQNTTLRSESSRMLK